MKNLILTLIMLVLVQIVLACKPTTIGTSPPTNTDTPQVNTPSATVKTVTPEVVDPGFNILVVAKGDVQLKRPNWSDYHQTTFGTALERGDLIQLPRESEAVVLCDGLTIWQVPTGAPAGLTSGCPQPPDKILVRGAIGSTGVVRGADDPVIPYIISPRMTKIMDDTPTLRWNDSGAASYNVQVRGGDLSWQQTDVTQTELVYLADPPLEPGVSYLLLVEDSNGKSSKDEGRVGLGFSLLSEEEIEKIETHHNRIDRLSLSDEAKAFALAQYYAGVDLTAEAIEILEGLIREGSQQASVHQVLADLYAQIGLLLLAEPRYLEAVELAEAERNIEAVADIQAGLGEVYVKLGNVDEAIRWLTQAQAGYETLGDAEQTREVARRLEELK